VTALAAIGWLPLQELSRRRLRREVVPKDMTRFFWFMVIAQIAGALVVALGWMEAVVWQASFKLKWPVMGILPAFALAWFGLLLGWRLLRQGQTLTIGGAPEISTRKLRYGRGALVIIAALLFNALYAYLLIVDQRLWYQRYWLLTFLFASSSTLIIALSVVLYVATRTESRVFWLFALLASVAFALELHAKLPMGQKWQSVCLGLLESAILAKALWGNFYQEFRRGAWQITRSSIRGRSTLDSSSQTSSPPGGTRP
jgi:hypothetical protein